MGEKPRTGSAGLAMGRPGQSKNVGPPQTQQRSPRPPRRSSTAPRERPPHTSAHSEATRAFIEVLKLESGGGTRHPRHVLTRTREFGPCSTLLARVRVVLLGTPAPRVPTLLPPGPGSCGSSASLPSEPGAGWPAGAAPATSRSSASAGSPQGSGWGPEEDSGGLPGGTPLWLEAEGPVCRGRPPLAAGGVAARPPSAG